MSHIVTFRAINFLLVLPFLIGCIFISGNSVGRPASFYQTIPTIEAPQVTKSKVVVRQGISTEQGTFTKPEYPGGEEKMYAFLKENIQYPAGGLDLKLTNIRVVVRAEISAEGDYQLLGINSLDGTTRLEGENVFTTEAARVVKLFPRFKPATRNKEPFKTNYLLSLAFPYNNKTGKIDSLRFITRTYYSNGFPYYSTIANPNFNSVKTTAAPIPLSEVTEPEFPGGKKEMYRYLKKNVKYPALALEKGDYGSVQTYIRINKDGSLYVMSKTSTMSTSNALHFEKEVIRVLKEMPAWKPAMHKDAPVVSNYIFSFKFNNTSPNRRNSFSYKNHTAGKDPEYYADRIEIDGYTPVKGSKTANVSSKQTTEIGKPPVYPGGKDALKKFLAANMQYPPTALQQKLTGQAIIKATIDEDGRIGDFKTIHTDNSLFDQEALRVLRELPRWEAGSKNGSPASYDYLFPFVFGMDTNQNLPSLKLPVNKIQYIVQDATNIVGYNNVVSGRTVVQNSTSPTNKIKPVTLKSNPMVYTTAEEPPVFQGGPTELTTFIKKNLKYPPQMLRTGVQGQTIAQFIISATGKIGEVTISKSLHPDADAEALRVIKLLPDFKPARQNGNPVAFQYSLPIGFGLTAVSTRVYTTDPTSSEKVYVIVDKEAYFPGSEKNEAAFYKYLNDSVKNSDVAKKSGLKGVVMTHFTIDKTGKAKDIKITKGLNPELDAEAIKIINQMPAFIPAVKDGIAVAFRYSLAIRF